MDHTCQRWLHLVVCASAYSHWCESHHATHDQIVLRGNGLEPRSGTGGSIGSNYNLELRKKKSPALIINLRCMG